MKNEVKKELKNYNRGKLFWLVLWMICILLPLQSCAKDGKPIVLTISAASSLKDSMERIKALYAAEKPDISVQYNFGASGTLQQQIQQGADVDIFVSAAEKQMDQLESSRLLLEGTRVDLLGNRIALIVAANASGITGFTDLTAEGVKKVAVGDPKSVPAGQYAQEVFVSMNLQDIIKSKLVYANNVRQVLIWVETGNADAGVVYETDAGISNKVKIAAFAPESSYKPVIYPAAVIGTSKNIDAAKEFMGFLKGEKAKAVFEKYGFTFVAGKQGG
jgi:molybdate transport system substrate-binding protein